MNLHKEVTRRKMIVAMLVASLLLAAAVCIVARQKESYSQPSVPVAGDIVTPHSPLSASDVSSGEPDGTESTTSGSNVTTTTSELTTTTSATTTAATTTTQPQDRPRTECKGTLTVETESANVRTDADKDAMLLRVIYKGERYDVIAQKNSPSGVLWYQVKFSDGTAGYVSSSYVRYDGQVVGGKVYLTFDDGPSENTRRILDTLDKYGVKATFFVIHHKGFDDVYRDIVNRGHTIALHSYSHDYENIYSSEKAFYKDLDKLDGFIYDLTGVHSKIIRFPGGSSNTISKNHCKGIMSTLTRSVEEKGYSYFDWNVDSGDADGNTVAADKLLKNIKNGMANRKEAVILMHDAKPKTTTADVLPQVIEYLLDRGYAILPLTEDSYQPHQKVNN